MSNEDEEFKAFRDAMKGVRPLRSKTTVAEKRKPPPLPRQSALDELEALREMANDDPISADLDYGDEAAYKRPEIPRTIMRRLRRGQYAIQAEIDLHGHTVEEAKVALINFLAYAQHNDYRCVRVIHGKGHSSPGKVPVLKPKVVKWLAQRDDIAAYSTARPVDGGTGALYVLLR
ncbi:MAG: Smr/MutS family protein [Gammaproteobacteria bacterium]